MSRPIEWTPERDETLKTLWKDMVPLEIIAVRLGTTKAAITNRRIEIGEPRRQNNGWDQLADERLRAMWTMGKTAAEIATMIPGRTRAAVIGRVFRLGLSNRAKAAKAPSVERVRFAKAPKPGPRNKPAVVFGAIGTHTGEELEERRARTAATGQAIADRFAQPANDDAIRLMDRSGFQCAWPVGIPQRPAEQMCCGAAVAEDANVSVASYCPAHARLAVARVLVGGKPDAKVYEKSMRRYA